VDKLLGRRLVDRVHVDVIRNILTKNIAVKFPELHDEAVTAMNELIPVQDGE
jgi:hypothetical protein